MRLLIQRRLLMLCGTSNEDLTHEETLKRLLWMQMAELSLCHIINDVKKQWKDDANGQLILCPENGRRIIRKRRWRKLHSWTVWEREVNIKAAGWLAWKHSQHSWYCCFILSFYFLCLCVSHLPVLVTTPVCLPLEVDGLSILREQRVSQQMAQGWHGHSAREAVWPQPWSTSLDLICILSFKSQLMQSGSV